MRPFAQAIAILAITMMAGLFAVGCSGSSRTVILGSTGGALKFKKNDNGQEITSWQLRPNETLTLKVLDSASGLELSSADIVSVGLSDTGKGSVTKNGNLVVFTASSSEGDTVLTVTVNQGGTAKSGTLNIKVTNNPNNSGSSSNSPLTSFEFRNGSVTGSNVVQPLQVLKSSSLTIYLAGILQDGTGNVTLSDGDITSIGVSNLLVGTASKSGGNLIFNATSTTGSTVVTVKVVKNGGGEVSRDLSIQVVDSITNPQPGGGSGSGNPGTVLTDLTISAPSGTPNAGQSVQITVSGTVSNPEAVNWEMSRSDLDSRRGVQSADGRYIPAVANTSVSIKAWGLGQVGNNPNDTAENWNQVKESNTVTITSSGTTPTGIMIFAPAYLSVGERFQFFIKDLDNGNDLTLLVTPSISDQNVLTTTNNQGGQPIVFKALRDGLVTVTVTQGVKTFSMKIRVGVGNPVVTQFNGMKIIDQYLRFGTPFRNPNNSNEWQVAILCNLSKCADTSSPRFVIVDSSANGTTPPSLRTFTENGTNILWGEHIYTFTGDTGTIALDPVRYFGKTPNPINTSEFNDTSKYSSPVDDHRSRFYDTFNGTVQKGFVLDLVRSSDPQSFRVNARDIT